jgi:hypothetical protein
MAKSSIIKPSSTKPAASPPPQPSEATHQCGLRIIAAAIAGRKVGAGQCAYATYVFKPAPPVVTGVVAPPVGVYWGPSNVILAKLPSGNPVASYDFVGGIIFENC